MADSALNYTQIMVLVWVLWTAALAMTVFRASFQWMLQRRLHADDHFVIFGIITLTALSAVITRLLPQFYLVGEYTKKAAIDPTTPPPMPLDQLVARTSVSLKLMFCQMLLFWTTLWAAKFSILFFIRRLVNGLPGYIKWWWACFTAVMLLYLACMLSNFLTCTPLHRYWSPEGCSRPDDLRRADASIKFATTADIVADLLTMILPLHLLRRLTISRIHKFGLVLIFSLGMIIIAFAIVRLFQVTKATNLAAQDPTTVANGPVLLSMWSHIESTVSIIVATLPAFRFLISKNRANMKSTNNYTVATIGGSGMSRKWHRGGSRLKGEDGDGSVVSSQTELRPVGAIQKDVEFKVEQVYGEGATSPGEEPRRRTQEIFARPTIGKSN